MPIRTRHDLRLFILCLILVCAAATPVLQPAPSLAACPSCVPLDDPTGPPHRGFPLGLYPGGTNSPPPAHLALALDAASQVLPRNAAGSPDPAGLVGFLSIGMSNTNQEFAAFELQEDGRIGRNPRLILVDGAVGGQSADVIVDPAAPYWSVVSSRLAIAGLDPDQVQVVWLKEADGSVPDTTFPAHADTLRAHLRGIVRHLKDLYPNLGLCYMASRTYGGYTTAPDRGEPLSYETGFAVRGLIEEQIAGSPLLNADPDAGPVEAPVLLWGAYLWTNGTTPRGSDGLVWLLTDVESDHVHPSPTGEQKVADLLRVFFAADVTAASWRDAAPEEESWLGEATADAYVDDTHPAQNYGGQPFLAWSNPSIRTYMLFDLGALADSVFHAKLSLKTLPEEVINGVEVVVVSNTSWNESTITAQNAPQFDGAVLGVIPQASRGTAISLDATGAVQAALAAGPGAKLCLGLRRRSGPAAVQKVGSRESIDPPRLVLGTIQAAASAPDGREIPQLVDLFLGPNPSPGQETFRIRIDRPAHAVSIDLHDMGGRLLRSLTLGPASAGEHAVVWDGADAHGRPVPSGIYVVRASVGVADPITITRKMVLLRP